MQWWKLLTGAKIVRYQGSKARAGSKVTECTSAARQAIETNKPRWRLNPKRLCQGYRSIECREHSCLTKLPVQNVHCKGANIKEETRILRIVFKPSIALSLSILSDFWPVQSDAECANETSQDRVVTVELKGLFLEARNASDSRFATSK